MNIFFSSHTFYPNVGGLETVALLLAKEFTRLGHVVRVITQTPAKEQKNNFPFAIIRTPKSSELLSLLHWSDVVLHNNISLKTAWPLLMFGRPWIIAHHTWIPRNRGMRGMKGRLKRLAIRKATNIAISNAIAMDLSTPCSIIPNPYDNKIFRRLPGIYRDKDLVFVGRLVSDKGADLLMNAIRLLQARQLFPSLTVIGDGPEKSKVEKLTYDLGIDRQVVFMGVKRSKELAAILNQHRIMVVPSLWQEPFGVVALEGIACGCTVVGSEGGGLKDAIGPCGCTFRNGDVKALADCLAGLITYPDRLHHYMQHSESHLARHRPESVAKSYLDILIAH